MRDISARLRCYLCQDATAAYAKEMRATCKHRTRVRALPSALLRAAPFRSRSCRRVNDAQRHDLIDYTTSKHKDIMFRERRATRTALMMPRRRDSASDAGARSTSTRVQRNACHYAARAMQHVLPDAARATCSSYAIRAFKQLYFRWGVGAATFTARSNGVRA